MINMIHGETITVIKKRVRGTDPFGAPIMEEYQEDIQNVLVSEPSSDDNMDSIRLDGVRIDYVLCIPKGDITDWRNVDVILRGKKYRTIGDCIEYTEDMIPLSWNKKVRIRRNG